MMRIKRLTGKFHLSRWAIVCLVLVVALASVGVTYAGWSGEKLLKGRPIKTAEFSDPFTWVVSNDDGSANSVDPGDNGLDPNQPQTMGMALPPEGRYTENVASTFVDTTTYPTCSVNVTINNAYPCYYPTIFYGIKNYGTVTAGIDSIVVDEDFKGTDDTVADDIPELTVTVSGIYVGQEIDPGVEVIGDLAIHVEQSALQGHTYTIRVKIVTSVTECGPCEGQVTMLRLMYNGTAEALVEVVQRKGDDTVFGPKTVNQGEEFSIYGTTKQGTLGPEIWIFVDGDIVARIHTSCSQPIGPGLVVGDFEVVYGESRNGGKLCPLY